MTDLAVASEAGVVPYIYVQDIDTGGGDRHQRPGQRSAHPGRSRISAVQPRLLPILLPSRWTTPVPGGQLWNVGPAHGQQQTVLDGLPKPTDQKVGGSSPSERATPPQVRAHFLGVNGSLGTR